MHNMKKQVILDIDEDAYKSLTALSDLYGQDVEKTINDILDVIGFESRWIMSLSKEYRVPLGLVAVMSHIFGAGRHLTYSLFDKILESLDAKGFFFGSDLEIDLDEHRIWVNYPALAGCHLYVDEFDVTVDPGHVRLTAPSYLDAEKVSGNTLERLKAMVDNIGETELPEEFYDLEGYSVEVDEDEDHLALVVDCTAESLDYSPKVSTVSDLVRQILVQAGIGKQLEE